MKKIVSFFIFGIFFSLCGMEKKRVEKIFPEKPVISEVHFVRGLICSDGHQDIDDAIQASNLNLDILKRYILDKQKSERVPLLHQADTRGQVKNIIAINTKLKLDNNAQDQYGQTPLNMFFDGGRPDLARFLVEIMGKNLDVSTPDMNGITPLHRAERCGYSDLAESIQQIQKLQNE